MLPPKTWPTHSAGPVFPIAPILSPLLRIVAGDPRAGIPPIQFTHACQTSHHHGLQLQGMLNGTSATIDLGPDGIPTSWFDFTLGDQASRTILTFTLLREGEAGENMRVASAQFDTKGFARSQGVQTAVLTDGHERPIGRLYLTYLRVLPHALLKNLPGKRREYAPRYTGHRGMGSSGRKTPWRAPENTPASYLLAAGRGGLVQSVELDVQLTADGRTVVYHDWEIGCGESRSSVYEKTFEEFDTDWREGSARIPMAEGNDGELRRIAAGCGVTEEVLLPRARSLLDVCVGLPEEIGFLIELKYPDEGTRARMGLKCPDRNTFVDGVLEELFSCPKKGRRRVAFLCFEPDICDMLTLKQSVFPVYLSHCEVLDKPCDEEDPRCIDLSTGMDFVKSHRLDGLMIFNELTRLRADIVQKAMAAKIPVLTYGVGNSDARFVKQQLDLGVSGVIVDDVQDLVADMAAAGFLSAQELCQADVERSALTDI